MKLGAVSGQDKRKHLKFWGMTFQLLFSEKAGAEIHLIKCTPLHPTGPGAAAPFQEMERKRLVYRGCLTLNEASKACGLNPTQLS